MSKKKHLSLRFTSALLCMTILTGGMAANWTPIRDIPVSAKTLAELQEERKSNEKKIAEKQKELDSLQSDLEEKEAYQKTLQEKITLQQSNLDIVSQELDRIAQSIDETTQAISQAEDDIKVMEADIAIGLDEFKMRLRAMYVQGNDSLASALVGATDFYDLLSKYELMSRVANHDNQLVNDLTGLRARVDVSIHLAPMDRGDSMTLVRRKNAEVKMQIMDQRRTNRKQGLDPDDQEGRIQGGNRGSPADLF